MRHLNTPLEAAVWLKHHVIGKLRADHRKIEKGDGFIAWPGAAHDGRSFVASALERGATACLVERSGVESFGFTDESIASYSDLKQFTGALSSAYFDWPSHQLEIIAVTGTNGKTSTTWWLAQALGAVPTNPKQLCGLIGTFGSGVPDFPPASAGEPGTLIPGMTSTGLTTPDPLSLQQSLHDFVASKLKYCAIEASSIGIQEQRLQGLQIHTAVFTNLTQDHLDYHGTLNEYWLAKRRLFAWPNLKAAVVNIDDVRGAELAHDLSRPSAGIDLWTFSCQVPARIHAENIHALGRGLSLDVVEDGDRYTLVLPLMGDYNAANLLGVIGALRSLGVTLIHAIQACQSLSAVPGRMECLGAKDEPLVVIDYAHTPDALEKALTALRPYSKLSNGRLICIFGCGGDRDAGKRPLMGAVAAKLADETVVTTDNSRSEAPEAIIRHIITGIPEGCIFQTEADRAQAIQQSIFAAQAGDVVLIAGKGHEPFQEVSGIRYPFSDRLCATAALVQRRHRRQASRITP